MRRGRASLSAGGLGVPAEGRWDRLPGGRPRVNSPLAAPRLAISLGFPCNASPKP